MWILPRFSAVSISPPVAKSKFLANSRNEGVSGAICCYAIFFQCIAVDGKRKTMLRLKGKTHRCKCPDYQSLSSLVFVVLSFSFPIYRVLKAKSTSPSQYYNPCHGYVINSWEWKDIQFPDKLNPLLMYHFDSLWS